MMSVNLNDMNWLPSILPALQCIFPSEESKSYGIDIPVLDVHQKACEYKYIE